MDNFKWLWEVKIDHKIEIILTTDCESESIDWLSKNGPLNSLGDSHIGEPCGVAMGVAAVRVMIGGLVNLLPVSCCLESVAGLAVVSCLSSVKGQS